MRIYKYQWVILFLFIFTLGAARAGITRKEDLIYIGQFLILLVAIINAKKSFALMFSCCSLLFADLSYYSLVYRLGLGTESKFVVYISSILYFLSFVFFTFLLLKVSRKNLKKIFLKKSELAISFVFILTAFYFIIFPATEKFLSAGFTLGHLSNLITLSSSLPLSIVAYLFLANHNNSKNYPVLIGFFVLSILDMGIQLETIKFGDLRFTYYDYFWFFGVFLLSWGLKDLDLGLKPFEQRTSITTMVKNAFFITALCAIGLIAVFASEKFDSPMYLIFILVSIFIFGIVLSSFVHNQIEKFNIALRSLIEGSEYELKDVVRSFPAEFSSSFLEVYKGLEDRSLSELRNERDQHVKTTDLYRQMAHDIISPLAVLNILGNSKQLDSSSMDLLKEATSRVRSIAQEIMHKGKGSMNNMALSQKTISRGELINLLEMISKEKILEHRYSNPKIEFDSEVTYFESVFANAKELQRVISNLINNSIESTTSRRSVKIRIEVRDLGDGIEIAILDNGPGFHQSILVQNFNNPITYGKLNGNGIGLFSAYKTLQKWNGSVVLENLNGAIVRLRVQKTKFHRVNEFSELDKFLNLN